MIKKFIAITLVLAIIAEIALLAVLPDSAYIALVVSPRRENFDLVNVMVPRFLAKAKLATFGFKSCIVNDIIIQDMPIVNLITNAYSDPPENINDADDLIHQAILSGCSVNSFDPQSGTTPLHSAILFNNSNLATFLIHHGANKTARLKRPGEQIDGLTPLEFAYFLSKKNKKIDRSKILEAIK